MADRNRFPEMPGDLSDTPAPVAAEGTDELKHDIVVEIYDGVDISMRCIPCRERIAVRPESAAASLHDLYRLADDHSRRAPGGGS